MINEMSKTVAVVGIGQVGFRACILFCTAGYTTFALDIDEKKIEKLKKGIPPVEVEKTVAVSKLVKSGKIIPSSEIAEKTSQSDVVVLCVPTPLTKNKKPNLKPLKSAAQMVGKGLKENTLVVIESTTYPGVTENIVLPILEKESGLKAGRDFYLSCCSERIDPGNPEYAIFNSPRVVGAINAESLKRAKEFYESTMDAEIFTVSNVKTAELVKLFENVFRDVNIALVNELARLVDGSEIDVVEVIRGAATKPFAFLPHYPGPGVGGECIPVSPYWLMEFASKENKDLELVRIARKINEAMPNYVIRKLNKELKRRGKKLEGSRVLVLGLTYKENVKDVRLSPALPIIQKLRRKNVAIFACDPVLTKEEIERDFEVKATALDDIHKLDVDCAVLLTPHKEFKKLAKKIPSDCLFFDTRNVFGDKDFRNYMGLGR
jgi:UDP-N-acetyl-D-glucosamine dehydrogenase